MYSSSLFEVCDGKHAMLIYEDDDARLDGAAHFINEGLKSGRLCVYASVHAFDGESKLNVERLSSRIIDYDFNIKNGNIQFIDFKPFYEAALVSNISPFVHLKDKLESTLQDRVADGKEEKIIVFADAACCLTENKKFNESVQLENWWVNTHDEWINNDRNITVICPHPAQSLREELEVKWQIADVHDVMVSLNSHLAGGPLKEPITKCLRILVADSEPDLMTIYSDYLSRVGHDVSVATDGNRCLELFKKRDFNLVILDTHLLGNIPTNNLAREIVRIEPNQKIIITTTYPCSYVSHTLGNSKLQNYEILQKPFRLSELLKVIKQ